MPIPLDRTVQRNKVSIITVYESDSFVTMGYHALKNLWTPVEGEELTTIVGLGNIEKKFAVAV